MKSYKDYSDDRLRGYCAYCDQSAITRDHVPAKAFLYKPYPENLHVVPACEECNNSLSKDEAYVAHLIRHISKKQIDDGDEETKPKSTHTKTLDERLKHNIHFDNEGNIYIDLETTRIQNVIKKFAISHILYELGERVTAEPTHISFAFINQLNERQIDMFNAPIPVYIYPEVGSRWMQHIVTQSNDWVVVQNNKYRYYIHSEQSTVIRIVIGEILYCEVMWDSLNK